MKLTAPETSQSGKFPFHADREERPIVFGAERFRERVLPFGVFVRLAEAITTTIFVFSGTQRRL